MRYFLKLAQRSFYPDCLGIPDGTSFFLDLKIQPGYDA